MVLIRSVAPVIRLGRPGDQTERDRSDLGIRATGGHMGPSVCQPSRIRLPQLASRRIWCATDAATLSGMTLSEAPRRGGRRLLRPARVIRSHPRKGQTPHPAARDETQQKKVTRSGLEPETYGLTYRTGFRPPNCCGLDFTISHGITRWGATRQVSEEPIPKWGRFPADCPIRRIFTHKMRTDGSQGVPAYGAVLPWVLPPRHSVVREVRCSTN